MKFPDLNEVQTTLGVRFQRPDLLQQALTHSSFVNEAPASNMVSNERLEYLGDAVIGLVIAHKLYGDQPQFGEGQLTRLRAALVNTNTLAEVARNLRLGDFLILGRGEEANGGRQRQRNLAAALEAVVGAIFLDGGLRKARPFILRRLRAQLRALESQTASTDYKSQLQHLAQSRWQVAPSYRLLSTEGPDHARTFAVAAEVKGKTLGTGAGHSKKEAEQQAARQAISMLESGSEGAGE